MYLYNLLVCLLWFIQQYVDRLSITLQLKCLLISLRRLVLDFSLIVLVFDVFNTISVSF